MVEKLNKKEAVFQAAKGNLTELEEQTQEALAETREPELGVLVEPAKLDKDASFAERTFLVRLLHWTTRAKVVNPPKE